MRRVEGFETSVFINCPFDEAYMLLLRPILFTIIDLGLYPRLALESLDSGRPRIEKIIGLIESSKYAIHDLSRLQAAEVGEYFRLNMPLELGIDIGCRLFKGGQWSEKKCLILEAERFRYQAAISDMSNSDIAVHGNDPIEASAVVRNWLNAEAQLRAPGPATIYNRFNDFTTDNYDALSLRGYSSRDILRQPIVELIDDMSGWKRLN
jgi:hypothetical protein